MKQVKISFNISVQETFEPGNCLKCPFRTILESVPKTEQQILKLSYGDSIFENESIAYRVRCNIGFVKECCPIKITKVR